MKKRIISGVVMAALFLIPLYFGSYWFVGLAAVMAAVTYAEYSKMLNIRKFGARWCIGLMAILAIFAPIIFAVGDEALKVIIVTLIVYMLAAMLLIDEFTIEKAGAFLIGIIYIAVGFTSMAEARIEQGFLWIFAVLLTIWATDSGAYFVGKKLGKRKLAEKISPNKTVEGTLGGVIVALVIGMLLQIAFTPYDNYINAVIVTLIVAVTGPVGDLIESSIKRTYNVKDSGNILPGHGGMFDRTDSWILVFVVLNVLNLF